MDVPGTRMRRCELCAAAEVILAIGGARPRRDTLPLSRRLVCDATRRAEPAVRWQRTRWAAVTLVVFAVLAVCSLWLGWRPLLATVGQLLVREDRLVPVAMIAVSNAVPSGDAMEAVRLYREGMGSRIVLLTEAPQPFDEEVRRLGVPMLGATDLARAILERSGVPDSAIELVPRFTDGTGEEIAAIAAYARERRPESLMYITARSHTARARWLLRRQLPHEVQLIVRSPRTDTFTADSWWRNRKEGREVAEEYLRWMNSMILGDPWSAASR